MHKKHELVFVERKAEATRLSPKRREGMVAEARQKEKRKRWNHTKKKVPSDRKTPSLLLQIFHHFLGIQKPNSR
jgi:hypothetical protein